MRELHATACSAGATAFSRRYLFFIYYERRTHRTYSLKRKTNIKNEIAGES